MHSELSLRKAAVLVASLDADTADAVLAQMPDHQAEAVRNEVLRLNDLHPVEQRAVIDEFFQIGSPQPESCDTEPSEPLTHLLTSAIDEFQTERAPLGTPSFVQHHSAGSYDSHEDKQRPLGFLRQVEPETLVPVLEREQPQVIALILAHLPHERAGHVLARLPAAMQTDVIRRMVDLEDTDPAVLRDVEAVVESLLAPRQPASSTVGFAAVAAILNASDHASRRQILNNLALHDRPLAHRLTPTPPMQHFTFAEVCQFPPQMLMRVIKAADRHTMILALAGAPAHLVELLLDVLEPEADWISRGLQHLGPLRLSDFERAQLAVTKLAEQLNAQGDLPELGAQHLTAMA
jgi:flagellar motor switch protein FliG